MIQRLAQRLRLLIRSEIDLAKDEIVRAARESARFEAGLQHARWLQTASIQNLEDAKHRVYSQFGEDGVIQYLLTRVPVENDLFIEFGVEDYRESNTRFLLEKDDWRGVIVDPAPDANKFLESSALKLRHTIEFIQDFVTVENINELFKPWAGDIGLLSIDVDGVDYFLWEALTVVSPRIVIVEFQRDFGPDLKVSTPYDPAFDRRKHHSSNLCAGASLSALNHLAQAKGYALVGTSGANNALFVRRDVLGDLPERTPGEVYRESRYRESMDAACAKTYVSGRDGRLRAMKDGVLVDVVTKERKSVGEFFEV